MITTKIAIWAQVKMVAENIRFIIPRNSYTCSQGHMAQWIKALVRSSDIPKKSVSSIPSESSWELSEGKLTRDN